jgi:hypothetical protein
MARPDPEAERLVVRRPLGWGATISALALLLPLMALTACGDGDGAATGAVAAPASGIDGALAPPQAPSAPGPVLLGTAAGFTPLPSPQQVMGPLARGRQDPFAPLPLPQAGPATPNLPAGFLFTGVIQSRGLTQAIVQLGVSSTGVAGPTGPTSATLCVGPRGICPGASPRDYQLPAGWSVSAIDLRQGLLSLRQGGMPLRLTLGSGSGAAPGQAAGSPNSGTAIAASASSASAATSPAGPPPGR